jgi:hypothetical protein
MALKTVIVHDVRLPGTVSRGRADSVINIDDWSMDYLVSILKTTSDLLKGNLQLQLIGPAYIDYEHLEDGGAINRGGNMRLGRDILDSYSAHLWAGVEDRVGLINLFPCFDRQSEYLRTAEFSGDPLAGQVLWNGDSLCGILAGFAGCSVVCPKLVQPYSHGLSLWYRSWDEVDLQDWVGPTTLYGPDGSASAYPRIVTYY